MNATIYVLMMLYWGGSGGGQGFMATHEFTSQVKCETAGKAADKQFNGWGGRNFYWVCSEK